MKLDAIVWKWSHYRLLIPSLSEVRSHIHTSSGRKCLQSCSYRADNWLDPMTDSVWSPHCCLLTFFSYNTSLDVFPPQPLLVHVLLFEYTSIISAEVAGSNCSSLLSSCKHVHAIHLDYKLFCKEYECNEKSHKSEALLSMFISLSTIDVIILSQNNNNTQEEQKNVHPSYELQQVGKTFYGGFSIFCERKLFSSSYEE